VLDTKKELGANTLHFRKDNLGNEKTLASKVKRRKENDDFLLLLLSNSNLPTFVYYVPSKRNTWLMIGCAKVPTSFKSTAQ